MNKEVISIYAHNLEKRYGSNTIFKGLTVKLGEGDVLAVTGFSGVGKTTLLKILGLLAKPSNGKLYINSIDTARLNNKQLNMLRREYIGFSFQNPIFIPSLKVIDNLLLPLLGWRKTQDIIKYKENALELLDYLGLKEFKDYSPYRLSYGQMKRVDLVRAILKNPRILILDEPTANLDEESATRVTQLIRRYCGRRRIVIFSVNRDEKLLKIANKQINILNYKD